LGLGEDETSSQKPQLISEGLQGVQVAEVACGAEFSLARSRTGLLFSWGVGERGQLGLLEEEDSPDILFTPTEVVLPCKGREDVLVESISCGVAHAAAIGSERGPGEQERFLMTWGENENGQLGRPEDDEENLRGLTPRLVNIKCNPKQVSCGSKHTALLDDAGIIWTWGYSECMQKSRRESAMSSGRNSVRKKGARPSGMASGKTSVRGAPQDEDEEEARNADMRVPVKVDWVGVPDFLPETVFQAVACGNDCTFVLTAEGQIYSWGIGAKYRLGHNNEEDVRKPKLLGGQLLHHEFSQVVASHSVAHAVGLVHGLTGTFRGVS